MGRVRRDRTRERRSWGCLPQALALSVLSLFAAGLLVMHSRLGSLDGHGLSSSAELPTGRGRRRQIREITTENATASFSGGPRGRAPGAQPGRIRCDDDPEHEAYGQVVYWDDPRSDRDRAMAASPPPFSEDSTENAGGGKRRRYLSFEPDCGGWNNIRMEFETMIVLAAATGRTLVVPPDSPLYLLTKDAKSKHRSLLAFLEKSALEDVVEMVTTREFFEAEILAEDGHYDLPADGTNRTRILNSIDRCDMRMKSDISCPLLQQYLADVADHVPTWQAERNCLVMDDANWHRENPAGAASNEQRRRVAHFCGPDRTPVYYDKEVHDAPLLHIKSRNKETRLLAHFYVFLYFPNPRLGNYYSRLVRDRVRYADEVWCAGGKIVRSLRDESKGRGYMSLHVRRGDFQWKPMKIDSEQWLSSMRRSGFEPDSGQIVYVATDETDGTFFDPFRRHYELRFLSDFGEIAGLNGLDPNLVGMLDQVVASGGERFVGTYFSSFSAYVGRIRGYRGVPSTKMYYGHPDRWNETHSWRYPKPSYSAREYPLGWAGIEGDDEPDEGDFF